MANAYQIITDRIIEKLETGTVPWRKAWGESARLGECKNLFSQKPYRGVNAFTTALGGYRSPYFLTYSQADEIGANVKKGEKGHPIVYFKMLDVTHKKADNQGDSALVPLLKFSSVFNVDQCENIKLKREMIYPEAPKPLDFQPLAACEAIVENMPQKPRVVFDKNSAFYSPRLDYVNMPAKESFSSAEHFYSVLFHELSHSSGHSSRLDRKTLTENAGFASHNYSKEELVAEMSAAFLSSHAGIDAPTIENSVAYIQSWLKVLKGDSKMIFQAAAQAQKATDYILGVQS